MTDAEIGDACDRLSGYFTRPGDLAYQVAQVRAHGITNAFASNIEGVLVQTTTGHLRFTSGNTALDTLIGDMLGKADQIAAAMLIVKARSGDASPHEVEEALTKVEWLYGKAGRG